jgi:clan AA aspartic protease
MKLMTGWWDTDLSPHLELSTPMGEVLDLVVDSGFNGELMLPITVIRKLGLKKIGTIQNILADGSTLKAETFVGEVLWFGSGLRVLVQSTGHNEGLLGTELFQGSKVELDLDAGRVVFRKKSSRAKRGSTK